MTTIAYRDGVFAYDSQTSAGEIVTDIDYDKCIKRGKDFYVCAGDTAKQESFVDAHANQLSADGLDVSALAFVSGTPVFVGVDGSCTFSWHIRGHWAIGSGGSIALGALDAGASALEAVKIAAMRDPYTGGKIRTRRVMLA